MATVIKASQIQLNQFIAIDFGPTIGIQWARVENIDTDITESQPLAVSVRMSKRFGSHYFEELFALDQRVVMQSPEEFYSFLKVCNLEF